MPQFDTMEQLADWLDSAPEGLPVVAKDRREWVEFKIPTRLKANRWGWIVHPAPHYYIAARVAGCRVTMYAYPADADGLRDRARQLRGTLRRVGDGGTKCTPRTSYAAPRTLSRSSPKQRAALAHQLALDGDPVGACSILEGLL